MTDHLWQSTWFALAVAPLTLAFRGNRANIRYALWWCASIKFLIPFSWLVSAGTRLASVPAAQKIATPAVSIAFERIAEPVAFIPVAAPAIQWMPLLLSVWAAGFAAIAILRLRCWLRIRAVAHRGVTLTIDAPVEVRASAGLLEPGVVGFFRPVLLLPEGIESRLTPPQLEAVLAHELCHVRRRDNLLAAAHMLVEALFWFHPLVWWIGARLLEERERACDEGVIALGNEPRTYADAIVGVCKLYTESPLLCVPGVTGADLKRRIEAIMNNRIGRGLNGTRKLLLALAGAAAICGPVAIGLVTGGSIVPLIHAKPAPIPDAPLPSPAPQERRLVAMMFDLDAMSPDAQGAARQTAIEWVQNQMRTSDTVAVMKADHSKVSILQDYTQDAPALIAAIGRISGGLAGGTPRGANLQSAISLLNVLDGKKALLYFTNGAQAADQADFTNAIEAANKSNLAVYFIDSRGFVPDPANPPPAAGPHAADYNQRAAYAQANFGSASSPRGRVYVRYGPPDQIEGRIWRYNYLESLHSRAELEFDPANSSAAFLIRWPPPLAMYEGRPVANEPGLPSGHATMRVYSAGEFQILTVPVDQQAGRVNVYAQIVDAASSASIAVMIDTVTAPSEGKQTEFLLNAGSYICKVAVKELPTGKVYREEIPFVVK